LRACPNDLPSARLHKIHGALDNILGFSAYYSV
jgi:hypothetical protein